MVCPAQHAMNVLDRQLAQLSEKGKECQEKILFQNLYGEDATEVYGYWNDCLNAYLNAVELIDEFCSIATKTRQVFRRKFAKYHVDRSHYQNQYDAIIDRVAKSMISNASQELKNIENIPESKFKTEDMHEPIEHVARDIYENALRYHRMVTDQRTEWPVISRQKKSVDWHNRGITKQSTRRK